MKKNGFTLVEIMVGVVLSGVVLGTGYGIFSATRKDFALATARQTLQHEVRHALDVMATDFKAMKAKTFKLESSEKDTANVSFERFALSESAKNKLESNNTYKVSYQLSGTVLRRTSTDPAAPSRMLCTHVSDWKIDRGDAAEVNAADANTPTMDTEKGRSARLDIALTGEMKVPITGQLTSHTEKASIFIRDEYYKTINQKKLSVVELTGLDGSKFASTAQEDLMLGDTAFTQELLQGLSQDKLDALKKQEQDALNGSLTQLAQVNDSIEAISAEKDSALFEPDSWGNFFSSGNKATGLQGKLKDAKTAEDVKKICDSLKDEIPNKEKELLQKSLKSGNAESIMKDQKTAKIYSEAFNLKLQDMRNQKAFEEGQKNAKPEDKKTYESLLSKLDPAKMTKFEGETDIGFKERVDEAKAITKAASEMDVDWADENTNNKNEVKEYMALKDLFDLSSTKLACIESSDQHTQNLAEIEKAKASAK